LTPRFATAVLALAATTAAASFGPRYGGALTVGVLDLPGTAEATLPTTDGGRLVARLAGETLVDVAAEGAPLPRLARCLSPSAGGREWTLELDPAATFHDRTPVRAADAARSLRRFLRGPSSAAAHLARTLDGGSTYRAGKSDDLPGLAAPDETRVVLRFPSPVACPLAPLASAAAAVVSSSGRGAGPFVPTVSVPGRRAAFTAFTGHVRGRPYLDEVEILALGRRDALRAARDSGRVDAAVVEGAATVHAVLLLRLDARRPAFRTRDSRAMLSGAIDRKALVARFIPGGQPLSGLLPPEILAAAGPSPSAPRRTRPDHVTMAVNGDVPLAVSQRVVAHLLDLGLEVDTVPGSGADPTEADLRLFLFVPEVAEAGLALEELQSQSSWSPVASRALEAAVLELDADKRRTLLVQAEEALRAHAAVVALAAYPLLPAVAPGVHGVQLLRDGRLVLEDAWREP
jgi:MarR-like DNA-binding transcriptional regulator SgrR of sgrS sRNA